MKNAAAFHPPAAALLLALSLFAPGSAQGAEIMTPKAAWAAMQEKRLVLVDVRREQEWRQTGVAPGAVTLTMGADGFYESLQSLAAANPGKAIGLICAAGGRSTRVAAELESRGLTQVVDIKAGMVGGMISSGWIDEGLPVEAWRE